MRPRAILTSPTGRVFLALLAGLAIGIGVALLGRGSPVGVAVGALMFAFL